MTPFHARRYCRARRSENRQGHTCNRRGARQGFSNAHRQRKVAHPIEPTLPGCPPRHSAFGSGDLSTCSRKCIHVAPLNGLVKFHEHLSQCSQVGISAQCQSVANVANVWQHATILGKRAWFNVPPADIAPRAKGDIDYGDGRKLTGSPLRMKF